MAHPTPGFDALASARRTVASEQAGLSALDAALADGQPEGLGARFRAAVTMLLSVQGRVIVSGMGKSGHIARKVAATLASTGTPASFVHPAEASHGDLGMITTQDAVLTLSWSGETRELADLVAYTRRFGVPLIAITAAAASALGRQADVALVLPTVAEACAIGLAPTTSTTMQLVLGDALAVALLEARGFSSDDFRIFHPGGKLGAQLMRVGDLMRDADALPLVPVVMMVAEAVPIMSARGLGVLIAVDGDGRLAGVVTDGDLRRHLTPELPGRAVGEIMTRTPATIGRDALAAQALDAMNSRKISLLVVVDEARRPVGAVHLQDLLRRGVA